MADSGIVLITGASRGLGRDLAERMSQAGYSVVATARRPKDLDGLDVAMRLRLDVSDEESVREAVAAVMQRFGRLDVLVNNAGFNTCGAIEELPEQELRAMFDVNVFGVVRMIRAVAPVMREQGRGRIVNISSLAGRMSMPVNGGYSATKFAVEALSDAARQELAPFGVRVILVEPGSIATGFADAMDARSAETVGDVSSPYAGLYRMNDALQVPLYEDSAPVEAVSRVVLKALADDKPKARYVAAIPFLARRMFGMKAELRDYLWAQALARA